MDFRDNFDLVVVGGELFAVGGSVSIGSQVTAGLEALDQAGAGGDSFQGAGNIAGDSFQGGGKTAHCVD